MPIETICKGCARKLRVADEYAGHKARCPHCRSVYLVPGATPDPGRSPSAAAPTQRQTELWHVRIEGDSQYGPVDGAELDVWVSEGRVPADAQLRREGDRDWQPAAQYYPSLAETKPAGKNPFADEPLSRPVNPYTPPAASTSIYPLGRFRPHRGGTILVLGILGLVCCQIAAPIAWAMAHTDLTAIRAGRMDPAGRGLTQAGMILGIAGTVILLVSLAAPVLSIAIG